MRKETKKRLEAEARKEWFRSHIATAIVVAGFVGIIALLLPLLPESVKAITATAKQIGTVQTDQGSVPVMMIMLENGATVRGSMPRNMQFQKEAKVTALEKKSFSGAVSYEVVGYADQNTSVSGK